MLFIIIHLPCLTILAPITSVQTFCFSHSNFSFNLIFSFSPKLVFCLCLCYPHCDGCYPVGSFLSPCRVPLCWGILGLRTTLRVKARAGERGGLGVWVGIGFLYVNRTSNSAVQGTQGEKADRGGAQRSIRSERQLMLLQGVVIRTHLISSELWRAKVENK